MEITEFLFSIFILFKFTGNRDPITKMLGDRFATVDSADSSTYRYIKEIVGNKEDQEEYGMWVLFFFKLFAVTSNKYL